MGSQPAPLLSVVPTGISCEKALVEGSNVATAPGEPSVPTHTTPSGSSTSTPAYAACEEANGATSPPRASSLRIFPNASAAHPDSIPAARIGGQYGAS